MWALELLAAYLLGILSIIALALLLANRATAPTKPAERDLLQEMFDELTPTSHHPVPMANEARNAYLTELAQACGNHTFDKGMREEFAGIPPTKREPMPVCEVGREVDVAQEGVRYEFLGLTGFEERE